MQRLTHWCHCYHIHRDYVVFDEKKQEVTSEEEEEKAHDECVSEVEERADESFNLELCGVEVDTVDEEVDSSESTCHEWAPPPVIVLTVHRVTPVTLVTAQNNTSSHGILTSVITCGITVS